jgi:DNA repair protein RecN (Recombination protein N)
MLKHLSISKYALIDHLELDFKEGLTSITGETGAGKSILLGAIGLILGNRADTSVVSDGRNKCIIEAEFDVVKLNLINYFIEHDLDHGDLCTVRREIKNNGKSRAFINDTPVTLSVLKEIGTKLVEIQTQNTGLLLSSAKQQTSIIDALVDIELIDNYKIEFNELKKLKSEFNLLNEQLEETLQRKDYLQFLVEEINELDPVNGEEVEIEHEIQKLTQSEEIKTSFSQVAAGLTEQEDNLSTTLSQLTQIIKPLVNLDSRFNDVYHRLQSTQIEIDDISKEALRIADSTEQDEERLSILNQRFDRIHTLLRKHRLDDTQSLIDLNDKMSEELLGLGSKDDRITYLKEQINIQHGKCIEYALKWSNARRESAEILKKNGLEILQSLGMGNAQIEFELEFNEDSLKTEGADTIRLLFSANTGIPVQEVSNIASGGELSRLNFAFRSVVSRSNQLPTLIYDEADTGISGEVAGKMAIQFREMGKSHQVISISHLPQVAAAGNQQLEVFKINTNNTTASQVRELTPKERIQSIAVMLSGKDISEAAIENAKQLLSF